MPDRPILDVFDTTGLHVVRLGDISGMPWGAAAFTLPEGTYGMWTRREGYWERGSIHHVYANFAERTFVGASVNHATDAIILIRVIVDEVFPFTSVVVPSGRCVYFRLFYYSGELKINLGTPAISTLMKIKAFSFFASMDGGAVLQRDYLPGPTTTGTRTFTSVKAQITYEADFTAFNWQAAATYDLKRAVGFLLVATDTHAAPTTSQAGFANLQSGSAQGGSPEGITGVDPGGGSGDVVGQPGGETPGGIIIA